MEQQVSLELAAQMRRKGEQRQQQQQEDRVFAELWEADRQAKEEREAQRVQRQQERNMEQLTVIKSQMEAAEQQRQDLKRLKEEEARLMVRQIIQIIQSVNIKPSVMNNPVFCCPSVGETLWRASFGRTGFHRTDATPYSTSSWRWTACRSSASSSSRSRSGTPGGETWTRA